MDTLTETQKTCIQMWPNNFEMILANIYDEDLIQIIPYIDLNATYKTKLANTSFTSVHHVVYSVINENQFKIILEHDKSGKFMVSYGLNKRLYEAMKKKDFQLIELITKYPGFSCTFGNTSHNGYSIADDYIHKLDAETISYTYNMLPNTNCKNRFLVEIFHGIQVKSLYDMVPEILEKIK